MKFKTYLPLKRYLALATLAMPTLVGCSNCDCGSWLRSRNKVPSTIDVPCFGYHSTCWQRWPEECANCPSPYDPTANASATAPDSWETLPDAAPPTGAPATGTPAAGATPSEPTPAQPIPGEPTPQRLPPAPEPGVNPAAPAAEPPAAEPPAPAEPAPEAPKPESSSRELRSRNQSGLASYSTSALPAHRSPSTTTSSRNVSLSMRERITKQQARETEPAPSSDTRKRVLLSSEPTAKLQMATRSDWSAGSGTNEAEESTAFTPAPLPDTLPEPLPDPDCEEESYPCEAPMPCELPGISPLDSNQKVSRIFLPFGIRR